ncbi:MAG: hypothetical protein HND53_02840 [Proteobacteria bacterium]|nr:hypothetical protein [Pseudomonadota bacterium]NOG59410.1 hypothetical protein [Pseudomonadota bacterium]
MVTVIAENEKSELIDEFLETFSTVLMERIRVRLNNEILEELTRAEIVKIYLEEYSIFQKTEYLTITQEFLSRTRTEILRDDAAFRFIQQHILVTKLEETRLTSFLSDSNAISIIDTRLTQNAVEIAQLRSANKFVTALGSDVLGVGFIDVLFIGYDLFVKEDNIAATEGLISAFGSGLTYLGFTAILGASSTVATGAAIVAGLGLSAYFIFDEGESAQLLLDSIVEFTIGANNSDPLYAAQLNNGVELFPSQEIHRVLIKSISNQITTENIDKIYESSSSILNQGAETLIKSLEKLITGASDNASIESSNEYFYRALNIVNSTGGLTLGEIKFLGDANIIDQAKLNNPLGLATRYALLELNPYILDTTNTNPDFYNQHNTQYSDGTKRLDLANFSEDYIEDRVGFLKTKIEMGLGNLPFNLVDSDLNEKRNFTQLDVGGRILETAREVGDGTLDFFPTKYITFGSDISDGRINGTGITDHIYGGDGIDIIFGNLGDDYLEGNQDDDVLIGGDGNDELIGGTGNDTLWHNNAGDNDDDYNDSGKTITGVDTLKGGKGNDTYIVGEGDIIEDSDGLGQVRHKGILLKDGKRTATENVYKSLDEKFQYTYDTGSSTLTVQAIPSNGPLSNGAVFTIKNFTSGDLGIELEADPDSIKTLNMTEFDDEAIFRVSETPLIREGQWRRSNDEPIPVEDILDLSDYGVVNGLAGDDRLFTKRAGSELNGGADNDILMTEAENTVLNGGTGDDTLSGSNYGDQLFGNEDNDLINGYGGADYINGGDGGDVLLGGEGNDPVFGGKGDDIMAGGSDNDQLFGGDDNDVIYGDVNGFDLRFPIPVDDEGHPDLDYPIPIDWSGPTNGFVDDSNVYQSSFGEGPLIPRPIFINNGYTERYLVFESYGDNAGIDLIYGGDGEDRIHGGDGNDIIDGGNDRDLLEGEGGDDNIHGGKGDDILYGDINPDSYEKNTAILFDEIAVGDGTPYTIATRAYPDGKDAGGNDVLYGDAGEDTIYGGVGDDLLDGGLDGEHDSLKGGKDNDTYQFGYGYGVDIVEDEAGDADKIKLLSGINQNDVVLKESGGSLRLILRAKNGVSGDILIIDQWFRGSSIVETIEFADGAIWDKQTIEEKTGVKHEPETSPTPNDGGVYANISEPIILLTDNNETFYDTIAGKRLIVGGGGDDRLFGGTDDDELQGGNDNDELYGEEGNDLLYGQLGNDFLEGGEGNDFLNGGQGNDTYHFNRGDGVDLIQDDAGNDRITFATGITANDISVQRNGNDLILQLTENGSKTDDIITVSNWFVSENQIEVIQFNDGASWDATFIQSMLPEDQTLVNGQTTSGNTLASTYRFQPSADIIDGFSITINDTGGIDELLFERVIDGVDEASPQLDSYNRDGNDLVLNVSIDSDILSIPAASGQVRVSNYYTKEGFIESIVFPTGILNNPNFEPLLNDNAADQVILSDVPFSYQLDANTFTDKELDFLDIKATLVDGSELPAWLTFDADTLTFSGTPAAADSDIIDVKVTATDSANQSVSLDFNLNVGNVNLTPFVANEITDQISRSGRAFNFQILSDTFADVNLNETLTYTATLSDGSDLPAWLSFDDVTGTFSGTPTDLDIGSLNVQVRATDSSGFSSSDVFTLTTNEFNSIPVANTDEVSLTLTTSDPSSEFLVNANTAGEQTHPGVITLSDDSWVALWLNNNSLVGQRFSKDGTSLGSEFNINGNIEVSDFIYNATALTGGGFVVTWQSTGAVTSDDIFAQRFDVNGVKIGTEFIINTNTADIQTSIDIAGLPDGGFIAVWMTEHEGGATTESEIAGQRFDANGVKVGNEFEVNTFSFDNQDMPKVAVQTDGSFAIVWESNDHNRPISVELQDETPLSARFYDNQGNALTGEIPLSVAIQPSQMISPEVVALSGDDYMVTWIYSSATENIYGQRFNSSGISQGQAILLNSDFELFGRDYSVVADSNNGFIVSWNSFADQGDDQDDLAVIAARFNDQGQVTTFLVNELVDNNQQRPSINLLSDGGLVAVWQTSSSSSGDLDGGIAARLFPAAANNAFLIDVLANDTDLDPDDDVSNFSLDTVTLQGNKGSVSIENNQLKFDPGNDFTDLIAGDVATVLVDYTMSDDSGEISNSTLSLTIRGTEVVGTISLSQEVIFENGGQAVASAGDVNGDGFDDVLIQGNQTQGSYLVFGQQEQLNSTFDLTNLNGNNGVHFSSSLAINSIKSAGDVNGDGFDDVIIGMSSDLNPGQSAVLFGHESGFSSDIDLNNLSADQGIVLTGNAINSNSNIQVDGAGDINGDGFDDVIIGTPDTNGTTGDVSIVFGRSDFSSYNIDIDVLDGSNGFSFSGNVANSETGTTVTDIGDINNDGLDDLFVYAPEAVPGLPDPRDPLGGFNLPLGYVVLGQTGFSNSFDINSLDGSNGFRLNGMYETNAETMRAEGVGDINGDGIDDLLVVHHSNTAHVIYGKENNFTADVNANSLGAGALSLFSLSGGSISSVSAAGDVNGDGLSDILIGMSDKTVNSENNVGISYLVYGKQGGIQTSVNLDELDGQNGFQLTGNISGDQSGSVVSAAGDVNGDGFDDLLVSAAGANLNNGESYLVYGKDFRNEIDVLGSNESDIVDVVESDQKIFTLDGNDIINVGDVETAIINAGSGENVINLSGEQNINRNYTIQTSSSSLNTVKIGSQSNPYTASKGRYTLLLPSSFHGINAFDIYTKKHVTRSDISIHRGSLIIDIFDGQIQLYFTDVDTNDLSGIPDLFERITFNDSFTLTYQDVLDLGFGFDGTAGDDELNGTEIVDRINGFAGNDTLDGGEGDDELDGGEGNDIVIGGEGNDIIIGNTGNDHLEGGVGDDTYIINANDGHDTILEVGGFDRVFFGEGLSVTDLNVSQSGDDLILSFGAGQTVTVTGWFDDSNAVIEQFIFTGDNALTLNNDDIEGLISGNDINLAPGVNTGLENQVVDEDAIFSYVIPDDAFIDPESGNALSYTATLKNGEVLPDWLSFDAATQTFNGTPDDNDVGVIEINVIATDAGGLSVDESFRLTINGNTNINNAPFVDAGISDQATDEDHVFSFTIPANTFSDPDVGDTLIYNATLSDDSALPSWLSFDAATQTFSGTPVNDDVDNIEVKVTVTDTGGHSVSDEFSLTVNNVNDAATVSNAVETLNETDAVLTTAGTLTSSDVDNEDNVFTASNTVGAIGTFDIDVAGNWTFNANESFDSLNVGDSVSETFNASSVDGTASTVQITINGTNDTPTLSNVITDQVIDEDAPFSFTIPANTFDDVDDANDTLNYSASLSDDSNLPGWLTFDAATQTFSGTPDNDDVGNLDIKVTATDSAGLSTDDEFRVVINNVNDNPVLANPVDDQATIEGVSFSYQLPSDIFDDDDFIHGDTLRYTASLNDGSALPAWLSFDAATRTFSGNVPFDVSGLLDIKVTVTDIEGLSVSDSFTLDITNVINGNNHSNFLLGTDEKDIINGFNRPDWLFGEDGNDILNGGGSNDHLHGGDGNDTLNGGNGHDWLFGNSGDDVLNGGNGNDHLQEWFGNNILNGNAGRDWILGGQGDDALNGGSGNDVLEDWYGNNTLSGGEGDDALYSGAGDDIHEGGAGHDWLFSDGGNDILHGGTGDDVIEGGRGNDTYLFNRGDDVDEIEENAGEDTLRFGESIGADDLWLWRDHKDLNIGIIGTEDQVTIEDWYKHSHGWSWGWHSNRDTRIERIELSDGSVLLETNVQQLVDAMAVFNVSHCGSLDVPEALQEDVQSVISTAWQSA